MKDSQRKAMFAQKRKMTKAQFDVDGGEPYETDIEFMSASKDKNHFSVKGDVPMLAMYYQNKSPEKHKTFRHLVETKGRNWRLYKNGKVIETSNSFNGIFKKWNNITPYPFQS